MSTPTRTERSVGAFTAIGTTWRVVLSSQARRGRIVALLVLGLVGVLLGAVVGANADDRLTGGTEMLSVFGLSVYAPVVTLVFASAALGEPWDDASLVYLWLRPVKRWCIVVGAWFATITVVAPVVLAPLLAAAVLTRAGSDLIVGTLVSSAVAVVAYSAIFVFLGLWIRRALPWGLAYVLLWEGFVALAGSGAAKLAIRSYTRSILAHATGIDLRLATISVVPAIVVPLVVSVVALVLATYRLSTMDVA